MKFLNTIIRHLFPSLCLSCKKIISNGFFCPTHWKDLEFITNVCEICSGELSQLVEDIRICSKCLIKTPRYQKLIASLKYNKLAKKLISDYKYRDRISLSLFFTSIIKNKIKEIDDNIDYIIPVPLHKNRLISRRYNQSAIICKQIAKELNFIFIGDLLLRTRNTKSQNKLGKRARLENTRKAFEINKNYKNQMKGKNILLIDDIITTGSTIENCCLALKKQSANKIYICSIAKTYQE